MKAQRITMGMPAQIDIVDAGATMADVDEIFTYWNFIEEKFSPFKETSEVSRINRGEILPVNYSAEMKEVLRLAEQTRIDTDGFFNIETTPGKINPVGLVKGWAIYQAAQILKEKGFKNFYLEIAGDIQIAGLNHEGQKWRIGIRNPFSDEVGQELIKVVYLTNAGIATSGNYLRGDHIYNPLNQNQNLQELISFSVIGPNIYEADRFATAVFAMGKQGIYFLEKLLGLEGYMVEANGQATMTTGFKKYTLC